MLTEHALYNHHKSISIGGRPICNPRFADDIDLTGGSQNELQGLINSLADRATALGMQVSTEKNKIMTKNTNNFSADISMNGQKLKEMTRFKFLWWQAHNYATYDSPTTFIL